jgi:hypothetical protein
MRGQTARKRVRAVAKSSQNATAGETKMVDITHLTTQFVGAEGNSSRTPRSQLIQPPHARISVHLESCTA